MKYNKFLLSDEIEISEEDYEERKCLIEEFSKMPIEFFSKLRHFQPQIGCLNSCRICSKFAGNVTEYWNESRQRNIIAALKYSVPKDKDDFPLIVWDREEHRSGVIFSYLDNDIGNYFYLDTFIELAYRELDVTTRISTVGFSRFNEELNKMHKKINEEQFVDFLGGVRLSFTPYETGWECKDTNKFKQFDYILDMANFLRIYKPYYEKVGAGSRKMCVELRYKPLLKIDDVFDISVKGHKVICISNYLFISKNKLDKMKISKIADPYDHNIKLTEKSEKFYQFDLFENVKTEGEATKIAYELIKLGLENKDNLVDVYLMENADGIYYSINPSITDTGNYGMNVYPITKKRVNSGYIITERFLVNAIIEYKSKKNLKRLDKFDKASWNDVYAVLDICKENAIKYGKIGKKDKEAYILKEILPMISAYVTALQEAGYEASDFFNPDFTIDTGIICNLGKAISEFCGITYKTNEPLTPVHERNYGKFNSKMTREGIAWRLSCNYNNTIIIEKLNLSNTTDLQGQVSYRKIIQLKDRDERLTNKDLEHSYLIPGQRR